MLSKVLNKSTCADCRFCCSFRRISLWETPLFPEETCDKLEKEAKALGKELKFDRVTKDNYVYGQMNLVGKYKTTDSEEEAPCEFLDPHKGCILGPKDKPFDCSIWPLRIMKRNDKLVIALTPTCPGINSQPIDRIKKLVDDGLGLKIEKYAQQHPYMIKEYKEGFPILMELS